MEDNREDDAIFQWQLKRSAKGRTSHTACMHYARKLVIFQLNSWLSLQQLHHPLLGYHFYFVINRRGSGT